MKLKNIIRLFFFFFLILSTGFFGMYFWLPLLGFPVKLSGKRMLTLILRGIVQGLVKVPAVIPLLLLCSCLHDRLEEF